MKSKADRITELRAEVVRTESALDKAGAERYMAAAALDKIDVAWVKALAERHKAKRALADAMAEGDA